MISIPSGGMTGVKGELSVYKPVREPRPTHPPPCNDRLYLLPTRSLPAPYLLLVCSVAMDREKSRMGQEAGKERGLKIPPPSENVNNVSSI
ncbi:hypothetical protein [Bacteroides sp.]|uniref:hypothetical protein n=1 Tax=Bacteroides sp. TaxID=29523 RepID=UPI0023C549DD|nr:hypothetical protein [Bacteroides sp.]MDE6215058.1 hypothetical protein [Bacteroides sp.]